jgi:hypothetical protein
MAQKTVLARFWFWRLFENPENPSSVPSPIRSGKKTYRYTSLIRKCAPLGP